MTNRSHVLLHRRPVALALACALAALGAACSGSSDDRVPDAADAGSGADAIAVDSGDATPDPDVADTELDQTDGPDIETPDADDADTVSPDVPQRPEGTISVPGTTESRSSRFRLLTASGPSTRAAASSGRFRLVRALHSDQQAPQ